MADSSNCTHDCSTCSANCSSRAPSFEEPNKNSHIKHVIGVVSGKGGVGKSIVWRGPVIAGTVKQFWTDVLWGDVDYMFVDCPPGTGDVPLTVFQSIPLDGVIIVTTPQDLVSMIVTKAVNMASLMNIPVIGLVENMAYVKCPDCGGEIEIFGKSKAEDVAKEFGIPVLGRMPLDPKLSALVDRGVIELMENDYLEKAADAVEAFCEKK